MRSRWMTVALAPAVALTLSCSDGTGPSSDELEQMVLAFCASELPVWFAFQNEGGEWTRVPSNSSNAFDFQVTPRVALAFTYDYGNEFVTEVIYTTADEIRPLTGIACTETQGTKSVTGSVANVPVGSQAAISFSGAGDVVTAPNTSFALSGIANNPQDLVAHREVIGTSVPTPNRVVIRRALNQANNSVLPVIDFGSEGQSIATHTASITGLVSGQDNYFDIEFSTASGTNHLLFASPSFTSSSQTLYGVPSTLTQAGDAHRISINADGSDSYRTFIHWTRVPGDQVITFGASLSQPSVSTIASAPYRRMRISLPAQADYDDFVTAFFVQGNTRSFYVTVTAAHVNGPITQWANEIPDVTGAGGFPPGAGLQSNTTTDWFVEAYDGSLAAYIGGTPVDGASVRYAGRAGVTSNMLMNVVGARRHSAMRAQLLRRAFSR
jgi:hypothetical protein